MTGAIKECEERKKGRPNNAWLKRAREGAINCPEGLKMGVSKEAPETNVTPLY